MYFFFSLLPLLCANCTSQPSWWRLYTALLLQGVMSHVDTFGLRGPYLSKDRDLAAASLKDTAVALLASVEAVPKYTQAYRLEAKFDRQLVLK